MKKATLDSSWFARTIPRFPDSLLWEITDACNLRCLHCEASAGRKLPEELDHDAVMELCDQVIAMKWRRVNITGGEPLLRPDWPKIAKRLSDGGTNVALITNGLLLDEAQIRKAKDAKVTTISVSLDGLKETHDEIRPLPGNKQNRSSFDGAIAALIRAKKAGFITAAITHVNQWNFSTLEAMYRLLKELDIDGWQLQVGVPLGRLREVEKPYMLPIEDLVELEAFCAEKILKQEKGKLPRIAVTHTIGYYGKHETIIRRGKNGNKQQFFVGCVGGWRTLGITSDGLIKPCAILPRSFAVGDLKKESLADVWNDADRFSYQSHWEEFRLEGYCAKCQYRCICRAGCTAMAYALTGSIYHNPYCIYSNAMQEAEK